VAEGGPDVRAAALAVGEDGTGGPAGAHADSARSVAARRTCDRISGHRTGEA